MKLQQMKSGQTFVIIPSALVRAKQWQKGDNIMLEINREGNIVLKRKE